METSLLRIRCQGDRVHLFQSDVRDKDLQPKPRAQKTNFLDT